MSKAELSRKENNEQSKELTEVNQVILTDITCYLRVSDISEEDQEEIRSDILRMFLDWQGEGKSVESMVGEDYRAFTESIITAVNPRKTVTSRLKEYLIISVDVFLILLTVDLISDYLPKILKGKFSFEYHYGVDDLLGFLVTLIISCGLILYIGKNSFELSKKTFSKCTHFIFGSSAAALFIVWALLLNKLKSIVILSISGYYIIGIVLIYWVYKGIKKLIVSQLQ